MARHELCFSFTLLWIAGLAVQSQGMNLYYGADVDGGNFASNIGEYLKDNDGYKTGGSKGGNPNGLIADMKADLGAGADGKFPCNGGVLFVYVSSHGGVFRDRSDGYIANNQGHIADNEFAKQVAATVPQCCTLVLCIDSCGTNAWWDNFVTQPDRNPFKDLNYVVAASDAPGDLCPGTPVARRIGQGLGNPMTAETFRDFLEAGAGVKTHSQLDDRHKGAIVTTPEPGSLLALALGLATLRKRQRAIVGRSEGRRPLGRC